MPRNVAYISLCTFVSGCGAGSESATAVRGYSVRDSAGVQIVTSSEPEWAQDQAWRLSEEPTLVLGGAGAGSGEELWQVRGLARGLDGEIAVVLTTASEVRIYDRDGARIGTIGRAGEGPGEFQRPSSVALVPPDTLLVLDSRSLQRFLLDGTFVDSWPHPRPDILETGTQVRPSYVLSDRFMLGYGIKYLTGPRPSGAYRPPQGVLIFPPDAPKPLLLGWYPGITQEWLDTGGGQHRNIVPPFPQQTSVAAGGYPDTRYAVGDNARYEIRIFDREGALRQIVRREYEPIPVRREWVEEWKETQRQAAWTRNQLPQLERGWQQMTVPETLPPFDYVHVDSEGNVWAQRVEGVPGQWLTYDVFAPEGHWLGSARVLANLRPVPQPVITDDAFVGVWTDDFDVESVRVYALRKPG